MIFEGRSTIAYKCPVCGLMQFSDISIFEFSGKNEYKTKCNCGNAIVKLTKQTHRRYAIYVPCIACNGIHMYTIKFSELWGKKATIFHCNKATIPISFIGDDSIVREFVDIHDMQMDKIMKDIGYDNYFVNDAVMLSTIDKIHDIAQMGNLRCQCGSHNIDLQMFRDKIVLICEECMARRNISTSTNFDLKTTLQYEDIIICSLRHKVRNVLR